MQEFHKFRTNHFEFINYINLDEDESRVIWEGRNHPEIRKWMTTSEPFSYEKHLSFIESLKTSSDRLFWAVKYEGKVIGAYILNPYNSISKCAESGKFLLPSYQGLGLGKMITAEFLDFIFKNGILDSIYAKTLIQNIRNQRINEEMGFIKIGQDEKYIYMSLNKESYAKSNNHSR